MQINRIKAFLQPPTDYDEIEVRLLGALQREGRRRIEAERKATGLARELRRARCRDCGRRCGA